MKKFVVYIMLIVIVLLIVVLLKNITTTKYSHSDIVALLKKGMQNMDNMNNIYFEKENEFGTAKYYYKGNKMRMSSITDGRNLTNIINLEEGKKYLIKEKEKMMFISTNVPEIDKGIQYEFLRIVENNNPNSNYKYELEYIRDEKIDNTDCIFVKEKIFYKENNEYIELGKNSLGDIPVCWIEKSTGFVIAASLMKSNENTAIPFSIIKNIKSGVVTDSDFELPSNYETIERNF